MTGPNERTSNDGGRGVWRWPLLAVALLAVIWMALVFTPPGRAVLSQLAGMVEGETVLGGPFSLVDPAGKRVTDKDLAGKPFAVFFGFANCPDICPTTLADMGLWLIGLGPDAERIRLVMITVDPERDTPAVLGNYMAAFDPRLLALTGTRAEVDAVLHAYRAYAKRVDTGDGTYTMDHIAAVYLMDAAGRYHSVVSRVETPEAVVEKLKALIRGQ
jgi:protein SCO1